MYVFQFHLLIPRKSQVFVYIYVCVPMVRWALLNFKFARKPIRRHLFKHKFEITRRENGQILRRAWSLWALS